MGRQHSVWESGVTLAAILAWVAGCSGTEPVPSGSGGNNVASAGAASAGGGGGGRSSAGQSNGMQAGTSGAGGPTAALDCSGEFGAPSLALTDEPDTALGSPTLSPDGLELFYVRIANRKAEYRRSTRPNPTATFPLGSAVPELDAVCAADESRSIDLSSDGLRAYLDCYSSTAEPVGPGRLRIADRPSIGAPFVVRAESQAVGPSAAIGPDELVLVSTSEVDIGVAPPRQFLRANVNEPFGPPQDIPGTAGTTINTPDLSPDSLTLYGGQNQAVVVLHRATKDAPFEAPIVLFSSQVTKDALGAPEVSQDCRSLFYVHQSSNASVVTAKLMVARR